MSNRDPSGAPLRDIAAAQDQMEKAISAVRGVAEVLHCLCSADDTIDLPSVMDYLSNRLDEHYEDAHDAFCYAFKLDEYAPVRGGAA